MWRTPDRCVNKNRKWFESLTGASFRFFKKKSWWKKLFSRCNIAGGVRKQENAIAIKFWRARNVENVSFLADWFLSGQTGERKGSFGISLHPNRKSLEGVSIARKFSIFPSLFLSKFLLNSFCECKECETYISWERTPEKFAPAIIVPVSPFARSSQRAWSGYNAASIHASSKLGKKQIYMWTATRWKVLIVWKFFFWISQLELNRPK